MRARRWGIVRLAFLICVSSACDHETGPDCIPRPCPAPPIAIMASVTSSAGGPVSGLTLTLSGAMSGSGQCTAGQSTTECVVRGTPGTYNLQFKAAGFQDKTLGVVVPGSTPPCGCTSVQIQLVTVVLTPR